MALATPDADTVQRFRNLPNQPNKSPIAKKRAVSEPSATDNAVREHLSQNAAPP